MWRAIAAAWPSPSQRRICGQARNVPTQTIKIAAWLTVMSIAISRRFQNGRVSWTPRITFIASMMASNELEDNHSKAASPNEMIPAGGCALRRFELPSDQRESIGRQQVPKHLNRFDCPARLWSIPIHRINHGQP